MAHKPNVANPYLHKLERKVLDHEGEPQLRNLFPGSGFTLGTQILENH